MNPIENIKENPMNPTTEKYPEKELPTLVQTQEALKTAQATVVEKTAQMIETVEIGVVNAKNKASGTLAATKIALKDTQETAAQALKGAQEEAVVKGYTFYQSLKVSVADNMIKGGDALEKACDKMAHSRLAVVGLPLAIMMRDTAAELKSLAGDDKKELRESITMSGTLAGATAVGAAVAVFNPLSLAMIAATATAAAVGALVGGLIAPPVAAATVGLFKAVSAMPKALYNLTTGVKRSKEALADVKTKGFLNLDKAPQPETQSLSQTAAADFGKSAQVTPAAEPTPAAIEPKPENKGPCCGQ